ncbi:MAG: RNA 2',3'-cyclic phosphodiesterase [Thermodesulfobacteriota bacterium]|nr:RNA 2',3'-cyclic phosphodiesterase [Thermodesulfobacteriota bacterium]
MEIRSFLAFELPPEIRAVIFHVSHEIKKSLSDLRCVKPENIHLTMVFMGNVHYEDLDQINKAVSSVCRRYGPFNISIKGAGVFGGRRSPRVLWVGLNGDLERMSYFRDALQKHLKPFGIRQEKRRFSPHLTLGRFRKGDRPEGHLDTILSRYLKLDSPVCPLGELIQFKSDLRPGGAVYTRLNTWPLSGKK